jgi:hypothetical protein
MIANLFQNSWKRVPSGELTFLLQELLGGRGQYRDRTINPRKFYLPLSGASCKVEVTYSKRKQVVEIVPGPAFNQADWERVVHEIESQGSMKVGRDISFSSFRVTGSWRGTNSGVQILPPPSTAPEAPEMAQHPFVLEFPVQASGVWSITNYRRRREHRRISGLLNVLLSGRTSVPPPGIRHFWAIVHEEDAETPKARWVQESFFADFGNVMADQLSTEAAERIHQVESTVYFDDVVHDGRNLQVPNDLDESICFYMQLSASNRLRFDRASFWIDMASRQWNVSYSASFASLVIAVEALAKRTDAATRRFNNFLDTYASGSSLADQRNAMYGLRSDILHGSDLMLMDQTARLDWSPPQEIERELMEQLWRLTQIATRNWLRASGNREQSSSN